jgi:ketosteroid isomerase-like protein
MRITKLALWFVGIVLVAVTTACTQTQNANTGMTTQPAATPEATPDRETITAEITRIEKDWPRIWKEKDGAAVRRTEADDIILLSFTGMLGSKEQDIKDAEAGNMTFESWEVSDINVKIINKDAAVASILMTLTKAKYNDGSNPPEDVSGHYRALDTFARRNGQWQVVASSIVKLSKEAEQALNATATPGPASSSTPTTKSSPPPRPAATRRPPTPPTNQ